MNSQYIKLSVYKERGITQGTQILLVWLVELYTGKNRAGTQVRFIDWIIEIAHSVVRNFWPIGRENLRPDQSDHLSLRPLSDASHVRTKIMSKRF